MSKVKSWGILFIIISLLLVAACGSDTKKVETAATKTPDSTSEKQSDNASTDPEPEKNAKKLKTTAMSFTYSNPPPKDGVGLQMLNEKFNVEHDLTVVPYANYQEKMSLTLAGGNMPDLVVVEEYLAGGSLYKWAKQGAFLPLNDYIDKYDTFKLVPQDIWDQVTVDGKIFAIPKYYPQLPDTTYMIRKDWLDNLGLEVPTSYEELKQVAIAFTKDDPDQNGKDDTYGLTMSENTYPQYALGPYWDPTNWYHKNEDGDFIPGVIGPGRKDFVKFAQELYKEGAITRDFGAIKGYEDLQKDFYSGKAGIYQGGMRGLNAAHAEALLSVHPEAKLVGIPAFEAPDGSKGKSIQKGFYTLTVLNGNLKDDPEKVDRLLQMIDYGRVFYPQSEWGKDNEHLDWLWGGIDKGYTMTEEGTVKIAPPEEGKSPSYYMPDIGYWAPNTLANQYEKSQPNPMYKEYIRGLEELFKTEKGYVNPINFATSDAFNNNGSVVSQWALGEQVKMIVSKDPITDEVWDKMVQGYLEKGGAEIIQEVNASLREKGIDLSNLFKDMN